MTAAGSELWWAPAGGGGPGGAWSATSVIDRSTRPTGAVGPAFPAFSSSSPAPSARTAGRRRRPARTSGRPPDRGVQGFLQRRLAPSVQTNCRFSGLAAVTGGFFGRGRVRWGSDPAAEKRLVSPGLVEAGQRGTLCAASLAWSTTAVTSVTR